jgi:hypothetical protein
MCLDGGTIEMPLLRNMRYALLMLRWLARAGAVLFGATLVAACGAEDSGTGGSGGKGPDPNANPDGDCMTNAEEAMFGTDPNLADTDGDGLDDCVERDCGSDALDPNDKCYACGWKQSDPGDLVSDGNKVGNTIANLNLIDQCGENLKLWDLAGSYHILFMTAAW